MNNIAMGFLTGFMDDQATKISERKGAAEDFFNEQMKLAQKKAYEFSTQNNPKMDASLQVAKQMMSVGVPESTVMAIINQNPDDLPQFYETVQKMQMEGVDMSNPDVYDSLLQIDGEFNPGNENVTSLIKRIYSPLTANAKADPKGFDFDPKGSMWATMLGYNAMERAHERLANSEVLPGVSASAILGMNEDGLSHPLGGASVTLNAGNAGVLTRDAKSKNKEVGPLTITEKRAVLDSFSDMVEEELTMLSAPGNEGLSIEERKAEASRRAAVRVAQDFPEAMEITEIRRWLPTEPEVENPSTAPVAAPTAPTPSQATPLPPTPSEGSEVLPNGAVKVRDHADGKTSIWRMPSGKEVRVLNSEVEGMRSQGSQAPTMQSQPQPGWLDRQGSEYD